MTEKLTETEVRVVGCLIEKQLTTPEYYPLTLNALVAACNQKTSREPVVSFSEETVEKALDSLREKNLAYVFTEARAAFRNTNTLFRTFSNSHRRKLPSCAF